MTMTLLDLVRRRREPAPWSAGDNIPWSDPAFSDRMLREHLSQLHDLASRRTETIERQVAWIHRYLLGGRSSRVLDLACGPGLYANRLARLGHECVGIDYSPAAIAHASDGARAGGLTASYVHGDLRTTGYGDGFDLVMLIYGELNVFRPDDAALVLRRARAALTQGGTLLVEPHTFAAVRQIGSKPAVWESTESGLFSDRAHVLLEEAHWDESAAAATIRYWVVDAATGEVAAHGQSLQAYDEDGYRSLLVGAGFAEIEFYDSMGGSARAASEELIAIAARIGEPVSSP